MTYREALEVLGIEADGATLGAAMTAYRARARECHPDACDGRRDQWDRLQEAYGRARDELRNRKCGRCGGDGSRGVVRRGRLVTVKCEGCSGTGRA